MTRDTYRVSFQPDGRSVFVLHGSKLVEAAGRAGIILNTPCGGEGSCGKCKVEVLDCALEPSQADLRHLSEEEIARGVRLACQLEVDRDIVITIPESTRMFEQVVLTESIDHAITPDPQVRKAYLEIAETDSTDLRSGVDRLKDALHAEHNELEIDLPRIRQLGTAMNSGACKLTAVLNGAKIAGLETGDTRGSLWGVAFDIGTTTVVGYLVDLKSGHRVGLASRTNPQVHFGDDVVSRINYVEKHEHGLEELSSRIVTCLNDIVLELADAAQIDPAHVYEVTAVGNSTMTHILLGIDPSSIAHAPYVSVFSQSAEVEARSVGLEVSESAILHVLPNVAGFVGSDTVGVILASQMTHRDEVCLAVDIGTNGEVAIGNRERLIACSAAAGPAFEGARIRHGMRAAEGAISKVMIDEAIECNVIGGGRAAGICGSGIIDALAGLLNAGIIEPTGRMVGPGGLPAGLPDAVRRAVVSLDGQNAVVLVDSHASKTGEPVLLTQRDVREVQLAKGAIRAGIEVICTEFGLKPTEVTRILLAGGFGNFVRRSSAKRIGLLPDVPTSRIEFIGNAAAAGARMALACRNCRGEAEEIGRRTEYMELANMADFQALFAEHMVFPEG